MPSKVQAVWRYFRHWSCQNDNSRWRQCWKIRQIDDISFQWTLDITGPILHNWYMFVEWGVWTCFKELFNPASPDDRVLFVQRIRWVEDSRTNEQVMRHCHHFDDFFYRWLHWKLSFNNHDDVIKWKYFPRNWPFVRGIHRSPVNSPHKGQWRGALMFCLICVWINDWVNNREAGDLTRYRAHVDVIVMKVFHGISSSSKWR